MAEPTYTCIATCKTCGYELNRATGVPESKRSMVGLSAPLMALGCPKGHDSLSDLNYHFKLHWEQEDNNAG